MNKEQWTKLLPVIEAYCKGETIQVRHNVPNAKFSDFNPENIKDLPPMFDSLSWEWRLKPEARDFWIVLEDREVFLDRDAALQYLNLHPDVHIHLTAKLIHVREVID